jgi:flagellar protein FlbD
MIELHRLNGQSFYLNHRQIELVESNPDTVITLHNDRRYIVLEKPNEISQKIIEFESKIFRGLLRISTEEKER